MSDLLQIGRSALIAFQSQLATTGHNVANASTPGYSRQRVELGALPGRVTGVGVFGAGVEITGIRRMSDPFIQGRLLGDAATLGRQQTYSDMATRLDSLLSMPETGLGGVLGQFFDGLNAVAADPRSIPARTVLLSRAESLSQRFAALGAEIDVTARELDAQLEQSVLEVNQISERIAGLNRQIALSRGDAGGQPPNDLLDERDRLLGDLAQRIGIRTVTQDDGSINAFTQNGEALVIGHDANPLTLRQDPYGTRRLEVGLQTGQTVVPLSSVNGGRIGGILDARREIVDSARDQLGRLAVALGSEVNRQHQAGVTLDGQAGGELFQVAPPVVRSHQSNTGSAVVAASVADAANLRGGDLVLSFDGSSWSARDARSGESLALGGTGTGADPFRVGGLSLELGGAAAAGDRFLVQPTADVLGGLRVQLSDPRAVAAAASRVANVDPASSAGFGVAAFEVQGAPSAAAQRVEFLSATSYRIDGGAPQVLSGNQLQGPGWRLTLSGTPVAGDAIDIRAPAADSADNGNALALTGLQQSAVLDGLTPSGFHGAMVSRFGASAQQAQQAAQAQEAIQQQNLASRDAVSGVNLDEEAAQLLRFQQAYQAAAQVVRAADEMFQTLLAAVRR